MRAVLFPGVTSGGTTRSLARSSVQSGKQGQSIRDKWWFVDGPNGGRDVDDGCRGSASCRKTRRRREEK